MVQVKLVRELTIGELSARSGVSQSALRFYEREGLISARRTDGNQRRYESVTLRRVALVQAGKGARVPLQRVPAALGGRPAGQTPAKRGSGRRSRSWGGGGGEGGGGPPARRRRSATGSGSRAAGGGSSTSGSRPSRRSVAD